MTPRFSIIIASYLGDYPGAATDREVKFRNAIASAMAQYVPCEIIVVSDGCEKTIEILESDSLYKNIKLVKLSKQPLWSGKVRQAGIDIATGEYIIFLDTDDFYGENHLFMVDMFLQQHNNPDVGYFDVLKYTPIDPQKPLGSGTEQVIIATKPEKDHIGNGMFCYKRSLGANYDNCNGYCHDWIFFNEEVRPKAKTIVKLTGKFKKDPKLPEYYVGHIPGQFDN